MIKIQDMICHQHFTGSFVIIILTYLCIYLIFTDGPETRMSSIPSSASSQSGASLRPSQFQPQVNVLNPHPGLGKIPAVTNKQGAKQPSGVKGIHGDGKVTSVGGQSSSSATTRSSLMEDVPRQEPTALPQE